MTTDGCRPVRIVMQDLTMSFGSTEVLRGICFDEEITSLAIIGPSGSGKSTLLRVLGGLLVPTSGTLHVGSVDVPRSEAELRLYRERLGFVFQTGGLFQHMTVEENITIPLTVVHGASQDAAAARARSLMERLDLVRQAKQRPAELSGGQIQRAAIARALAAEPELLLLDEPTSALDPELTTEVLDVLRGLALNGTRMVIVTHEMGFARHACDSVAFLDHGQILETGRSESLFGNPSTPQLQSFLARLLEWEV